MLQSKTILVAYSIYPQYFPDCLKSIAATDVSIRSITNMFRFIVVLVVLATAVAFTPARLNVRSQIQMSAAEKPSMAKMIGAALVASTFLSLPAFAVEGAAPKQSFFGSGGTISSSPFSDDDNMYSPYSPWGDGKNAIYNERKGGAEEKAFWSEKLEECAKRVDRVPSYVAKARWFDVTTELTRYTYNMRESMNRLAAGSANPKAAKAAAKEYFVDLNDMTEWAVKKNGPTIQAAYEKSLKDLIAFREAL